MDAELNGELSQQIAFLQEIDRLKEVMRQSELMDGSRRENSAEHSWHVAMAAMILSPYANAPVDLCRVIRMLLIHDIVEIDAGDTFIYDDAARKDQASARRRRLSGSLGFCRPTSAMNSSSCGRSSRRGAAPRPSLQRALTGCYQFCTIMRRRGDPGSSTTCSGHKCSTACAAYPTAPRCSGSLCSDCLMMRSSGGIWPITRRIRRRVNAFVGS